MPLGRQHLPARMAAGLVAICQNARKQGAGPVPDGREIVDITVQRRPLSPEGNRFTAYTSFQPDELSASRAILMHSFQLKHLDICGAEADVSTHNESQNRPEPEIQMGRETAAKLLYEQHRINLSELKSRQWDSVKWAITVLFAISGASVLKTDNVQMKFWASMLIVIIFIGETIVFFAIQRSIRRRRKRLHAMYDIFGSNFLTLWDRDKEKHLSLKNDAAIVIPNYLFVLATAVGAFFAVWH